MRRATATPATAGAHRSVFDVIRRLIQPERNHRYFASYAITATDRAVQCFVCKVIGTKQIKGARAVTTLILVERHRILLTMAKITRFDYTTERITTMTRTTDSTALHPGKRRSASWDHQRKR
jgi:hypothetical protein